VEEEKKQDLFLVAKGVYDLLSSAGLSKRETREVLDLVCTRYGLRTAPIGVGLVSFNQQVGASPAKPKGLATKPKDPVNLDPEVMAAQERVNSLLSEIRAFKARNEEVPEDLLAAKAQALVMLKEAKASFRGRSQ